MSDNKDNELRTKLVEKVSVLTISHIYQKYGSDHSISRKFKQVLQELLGNRYEHYSFDNVKAIDLNEDYIDSLAKINEFESRRKDSGVYYTDHDATDFLAANTLLHYVIPNERRVYSTEDALKKIQDLDVFQRRRLLNANVIDPTCGLGEFLISIVKIKKQVLDTLGINDPQLLARTTWGNDIEKYSTDISKLRLFFLIAEKADDIERLNDVAKLINLSFMNNDAIGYHKDWLLGYDIIIGNPPYVEYRNYWGPETMCYGNVYADVLHQAASHLAQDGIMAFVIPLSFVSTSRMAKIRDFIFEKTDKQIVLHFADRPDCLFTGVHQKLTMLIAQKNTKIGLTLSSSYRYWSHSERSELFRGISLCKITNIFSEYCPKIGNEMEHSIFTKFHNLEGLHIGELPIKTTVKTLFVNQRACFWMKVFPYDMNSKSYARIQIPIEYFAFVYCLLNSSLFYLLWVVISDGWHVTKKEITFVKIPKEINISNIWKNLMERLVSRLEETKVYVHTKQVEYEYKHKDCKDIIDEIDNMLALIYKIPYDQLQYIKEYAIKYRTSNGK